MIYNEFIQGIIDTRGQWSDDVRYSSEGCERHHIIPVCMGGQPKNKTWKYHENIIWLYYEEHFIAHKLLAEENPTNQSLCWAYWRMCNKGKIVSPEDYSEARKLFVESISGDNNPNKIPWNRGLTKETSESVKRTAEKLKGSHTNKGIPKSELHKQHLSESKIGKVSGANNPFYGKHHSEESKEKNRQAHLGKKLPSKWKKVICVETGIIYESVGAAQLAIGGKRISSCLTGKCKSVGGYTWKYYEG